MAGLPGPLFCGNFSSQRLTLKHITNPLPSIFPNVILLNKLKSLYVSGLRCYTCNTYVDPSCGDPYNLISLNSVVSLIDCSTVGGGTQCQVCCTGLIIFESKLNKAAQVTLYAQEYKNDKCLYFIIYICSVWMGHGICNML